MKKVLLFLLSLLLLVACEDRQRVVTPTSDQAKLVMDKKQYDFGTLTDDNGVVEHTFQFVNEGREKLVINRIHAYCHCTAVDYPKEPIKPGHASKIKVYLNTRDLSPGHFTRTIEIFHNGIGGQTLIFVRGEKI